ncbi:inositol 2-dehydrogenase [Paenibacillus polygoni]|uniref:Inositol 2-dehydrogenase n=1 Tax=Paenibacillus polygoni TaxID=3050112 RepID=A0ABY8X6R8_9BACL|nr:inositol 2-dehydrogenase [Paenibacillus polygoni]WIV21242.1 inositol 2-dehydrogenase [Paenibacillus polygoni]
MDSVKIGIIGGGRIGKIHADHVRRLPNVEIVGIADLFGGEPLAAWCYERGIPYYPSDGDNFISNPDIDAIFICSPTDTHVSLIRKAVKAGKHIFCEKPVSQLLLETEKAMEEVSQANIKFQVGFNRRFDHNFLRLREHVQQGTIGEPHIIKITSRDPNPPHLDYIRSSGGIYMDMMIHDFDMARYVSGSEVESIYAQGNVLINPAFRECGDVDTAIVTLRFENGALGVIDNSRQAVYGYDQRVEVFGSKGSVAVTNDHPNTAIISTAEGVMSDKPLHFFLERYEKAYELEVRMFIDSIIQDTPVTVNGYDGLQAERIAYAAKCSARLGRPVRMDEIYQITEA